ncbi:hypothetical protein EU527_00015 [Candidatus Thorarchaeota archaeon]|nr:MAG: hypothetical protein EU527_00015 [Candidatus Thorarchaeota archaeon]
MKQSHLGLFIIIGSIIAWSLATSVLFDYITRVLHPNQAFGEPIWVIDPVGFLLISLPLGILLFIGVVILFDAIIPKTKDREIEVLKSVIIQA